MSREKYSGFMARTALSLVGGKEMRLLHAACAFPRVSQARTLRMILESAKDTVYGREHKFSEILAAGTDENMYSLYRQYNAPAEYENFRPYVNRMMQGEADVLFAGRPALYATTSGSTADPKYVPISASYLENCYGRMTRLWVRNFLNWKKKALSGKMFTVVGKKVEGHTPDGTVIGSVSSFLKEKGPAFIRKTYPVPSEIYDIEDYTARNYAIMRFAIEHNVTIWITPNPSTILELQNNVDEWLDEFIEDIGNGTLSDKFAIPDDIRKAVSHQLKPNIRRAYELRALQSQYDRVLPKHYWPDLQIVCSWKCGNTQIYLKKMGDFFPASTFHQELGYFATECRFGLVLDGTVESYPMPHMHFYEFKREKDLGDPEAPFYMLYELRPGERYCPFVTTLSGLYRYNMNDIVQVGDYFLNTPRMHMVQKVNGIVSITGEKLYEEQFIRAVDMAQEQTGLKLSYYTGYVNLNESRYDWYFEFSGARVRQKKAEEFAAVVDGILKELNIEYASKRDSFRLKAPAVYLLQRNAFDKFKEFILGRNKRDASRFKPNVLAQNENNHEVIHSLRKRDDEK